ncbi:serine/threonine protein phosphatase PrpC [Saccharothrix coeruleofusca]|uniref:protein phosphatase 2C domain-containing protein n=1 Tax=Saccharothrix coeruleofusca TaxID=33919 RepID=UPI001AE61E31|nr:protein phosphatase 2C domain-containing protein [Saccharothrix coeruleofusca]MBP2333912.1 serine/threonine protein phosphatase PrpC [Saccharothrix coeruleofusca]
MGASTREHEESAGSAEPAAAPAWRGRVEQFEVGDPGRAATRVVPVPDESAWDRRDTVLDGVALKDGGRRVVAELRAASVRGLAHRAYGTVRQDEYGYRRTPDGRYLVVGVADGVSAGALSHKAAVAAARRGVNMLVHALRTTAPDRMPWPDFLRAVAAEIEAIGRKRLAATGTADPHAVPLREVANLLATTVLYAVVDLVPVAGAHEVHLVSVGDTSAWVLREGGRWEPQQAVKNDGAEVHSSSVQALPLLPAALPPPVRTTVAPGEALVLVTDGVGDPLGHGAGAVGRFLAEVWAAPPASGLEFAAQAGFARRSYDDDRTAVALWPVAGT